MQNQKLRIPKKPKSVIPALAWEIIAGDDFVCHIGDYCLRVEKMKKDNYWWSVYYKDSAIAFDDTQAKTELEAKLLAEAAFLRHKVT